MFVWEGIRLKFVATASAFIKMRSVDPENGIRRLLFQQACEVGFRLFGPLLEWGKFPVGPFLRRVPA